MTEKLAAGKDYGNRSVATTIGDMTLVECEYTGEVRTPSHFHARPYFGFALSGGYTETYRHRTLDVRGGRIAWHPAEERHVTELPGAGLWILRVELSEQFAQRVFQRPLCDEPRLLGRDSAGLTRRIRSEMRNADELSPIVLEALMTEALAALLRQPSLRDSGAWLRRTYDHIHDCFARPVPLSELATEAGVHPTHLTRAFRQQYGCTIGEMIRQLRIDQARDLLARTDLPQADIALETGFSSQSHFAIVFRRLAGMTPGAYRRSARSKRED